MNRSAFMRAGRRCALAVSAAAVVCAGTLVPAASAQEPAESTARELGVSVSRETSTPEEIRAFWTPERVQKALDNPMTPPTAAAAAPAKASGDAPRKGANEIVASAPAVGPAAGGPGATRAAFGDAATAVANKAAADIAVSQPVPMTSVYPMNLVGKLFIYDEQGKELSTCSAAVINTRTKSTIWTAAHCVHKGDNSGQAGFHKKLMFRPAYNKGQTPWGDWTVTAKYAPVGYTEQGDSLESDFAAAELAPLAPYGKIVDAMGGFGYSFGSADHPEAVTAGYPGEGYKRTDLDAERMMACYGNAEDNANFNPFDNRIKMDCDMGKGSSGGPMAVQSSTSGIQIIGANSHYLADATTNQRINDDLLSSEHGVRAANVIDAVNAGA
ncbi:trypsin-like serine peptidase [Streptomyces sp. NPDC020412]|uniref:trypsin-like serine peptidase n=1 Tax=Streptomyces sp. NPDC020412 TaxID=3365073 RepID=UPI00379B3D4F